MLSSAAHGVANRIRRLAASVALVAGALWGVAVTIQAAEPPASRQSTESPPPAWPGSPFHGVISGATGAPIPCRCRFQGNAYRLGDTVCMNTFKGVQLARCDLNLNNTSWVPTGLPCTMSRRGTKLAFNY